MGMIGNYTMTDESTINKILARDITFEEFFYDDEDEPTEDFLDIDKSWHIIYFTLTGAASDANNDNPLSKVVLGGRYLGEQNIDFEFPRCYLLAEEAKQVNAALRAVSSDDFAKKFDFEAMLKNDIYIVSPAGNADDLLEYSLDFFEAIKLFFEKAASDNKCLICWID